MVDVKDFIFISPSHVEYIHKYTYTQDGNRYDGHFEIILRLQERQV